MLRVFSHPGLARLVASFRWREGAYFVLEYASRGDLHTQVPPAVSAHSPLHRCRARCRYSCRHGGPVTCGGLHTERVCLRSDVCVCVFPHPCAQITSMGSLDDASTRFLIGEVVAALGSIHDAGFVYGDLKPENIVLTTTGHAKLTDFGAVRPLTGASCCTVHGGDCLRLLVPRDGALGVASRCVREHASCAVAASLGLCAVHAGFWCGPLVGCVQSRRGGWWRPRETQSASCAAVTGGPSWRPLQGPLPSLLGVLHPPLWPPPPALVAPPQSLRWLPRMRPQFLPLTPWPTRRA